MENKRDPELKLLTSFKSYTGLLGYTCILGLIIAFIGIVCPFCSYNPTKLEATKQIVQFWDLLFFYIALSIVLIILAFALFEFSKYFTDWRSRKKLFIIFAILAFLFIAIAYTLTTFACVFYEIPEKNFSMLEIDFEVGFYLYTVGIFIFAIAYAAYSWIIIKIITGKTEINSVLLNKNSNNN